MSHDPVCLERSGHRTWLKWHRGRRHATDLEFSPERILEGMRLGASVEIDLVSHAGGGFVVLHDDFLETRTTGRGPVNQATAEVLKELKLRENDGAVSPYPVALMSGLCKAIAATPVGAGALLQLDLKPALAELSDADIGAFARDVQPALEHVILSGGDKAAVLLLAEKVPGLKIGYDPCHFGAADRLRESRAYSAFVETALAAAPAASMIYLEASLVLMAEEDGFDLIGAFHAADKLIDAYTIRGTSDEDCGKVERLLRLKADQITTDDPQGLFDRLQVAV